MRSTEGWDELLDAVREDIGEGKVRGFGENRYLEFSSDSGQGELRRYDQSVYLIFHGKKAARTDLRIGRAPIRDKKDWQALKTVDPAFDAVIRTWSRISGKPGGMLSKSARSAFLDLVQLNPKVHLFVDGKEITVVTPDTDLDGNGLAAFVLKAVACIDQILPRA